MCLHRTELVIYVLAVLVIVGCWCCNCTATEAGPSATVQTAGVLADLAARIGTLEGQIGPVQIEGVEDLTAALASFRADVEAVAVKLTTTSTAGRDVTNADAWVNRGLLGALALTGFVYMVINERRQRRNGG